MRSAVLIGQALSRDGETAAVRAPMDDPDLPGYFRDAYRSAPDGPEHFDVIFDKIRTMWRNPLEMPIGELSGISTPVLVLQGDDDGVRIDWNLALAAALPLGQLAVVPGAGHAAPMQKVEVVNRLILDFLADQRPERWLPLGSLHDRPAA